MPRPSPGKEPLRDIAKRIAAAHGFTLPQLAGSRAHRHVRARQHCWAEMRRCRPDASLRQMGVPTGRQDHTTVGWGIAIHQRREAACTALLLPPDPLVLVACWLTSLHRTKGHESHRFIPAPFQKARPLPKPPRAARVHDDTAPIREGRPSSAPYDFEAIARLRAEGMSWRAIARHYGVDHARVRKWYRVRADPEYRARTRVQHRASHARRTERRRAAEARTQRRDTASREPAAVASHAGPM